MMERIEIFNVFCFSILMIITHAFSITAKNYDFKCPDTPHRKFRAKWLCESTEDNYSCLFDIWQKEFTESCSFTSDFVRPGQKYVISGLRKNTNCSNLRYQPFKFYSSELSQCVFVKNACGEEGQNIFSEGSTIEDRNCRCDYTKGYTFLSRPTNQCFCTPGEADCSCYIVNCLKNSPLSSDYECKVDNLTHGVCQSIDDRVNSHNTEQYIEHIDILQSSIERKKRNITVVIVIVIITVMVIVVFTTIVIMVIETDTLQTATYDQLSNLKSDIESLNPAEQIFSVQKMFESHENKNKDRQEEEIFTVQKMFESLESILQMKEFNKDLREELSVSYPNADYMNVLNSTKINLVRDDCGIVIAGETSAGKTTLINKFVGTKIFPTNNVAATATVCRIRNSKELMLKAFTKDECLLKEVKFENMEQMKSVIKKFTDIKYIEKDMKDKEVYYTDVYLPVPILKGNFIIVDTPGIGESEEFDDILLNFLPQAVSFIFIVNARNAGGIHEDRLSRIYRNIWGNIECMPYFNPKEVFFLTNQWDIVEDDDDDEDEESENETITESGSRTWKLILNKLKRGWPGVEHNRIYQISLNPMSSKNEEKYTSEFQRFRANLTETILKNQNKQVEFYLSFLQKFVRNAECGIAFRLKLGDSTEEEHHQIIDKFLKSIERLEADNSEFKEELTSHKNELINCLVDLLLKYIHSNEAKNDVLHPKGGTSIENFPPEEWESVITSRLNYAIEKWFGKCVVKEKIEEANAKIMFAVKKIESKIENLEIDMTGIKPQPSRVEQSLLLPTIFKLVSSDMSFWHFQIMVFKLIYMYDLTSFYWYGPEAFRKKAVIVYDKVLEGMKKEKLQELFENFFGKEYSKTISRLFDCDIPNKIKSMKKTNESMMENCLSLRLKHGSFQRLNKMMEKLKAEMVMYQDTHRKVNSMHV